jgi:hypothetical protein
VLPNNVPNRALYNLNDSSGVHISEAGASVISDIILDYVKSPVEGEYTTPNTKKNVSEVQHQSQVQQIKTMLHSLMLGCVYLSLFLVVCYIHLY